MNKGVKIALGITAGACFLLGARYVYTRKRLVDNISYRPEPNFQRSQLLPDKLVLSLDLVINNPTPNSITITKPTITLRYTRPNVEDIPFVAIPSSDTFTIGTGQTIISDIKIEILYNDAFAVGRGIIERLIRCEKVEFMADVALTVDKWYFISQKNVKAIAVERKDLPTRLTRILPPCGSAAQQLVSDLISGKTELKQVFDEAVLPTATPISTSLGRLNRNRRYAGRR